MVGWKGRVLIVAIVAVLCLTALLFVSCFPNDDPFPPAYPDLTVPDGAASSVDPVLPAGGSNEGAGDQTLQEDVAGSDTVTDPNDNNQESQAGDMGATDDPQEEKVIPSGGESDGDTDPFEPNEQNEPNEQVEQDEPEGQVQPGNQSQEQSATPCCEECGEALLSTSRHLQECSKYGDIPLQSEAYSFLSQFAGMPEELVVSSLSEQAEDYRFKLSYFSEQDFSLLIEKIEAEQISYKEVNENKSTYTLHIKPAAKHITIDVVITKEQGTFQANIRVSACLED